MTLVDAHHHLLDDRRFTYPWIAGDHAPLAGVWDDARLAPSLEAAGVGASMVVQTVSSLEETVALLALADGHPFIRGVVGWVDLTGDVAPALSALRSGPGGHRLVGIRHQVQDEDDTRWLLRPDVVKGLAAVAEAGLVYDLLVLTHQLPAATELAHRLPDLRLVLDHLAKPPIRSGIESVEGQAWAGEISALAAVPSVVAKVSGLVTEADWNAWEPADLAPWVAHAVAAFGAERILFGSDWPVCTLAAGYGSVLAAATATAGRDAAFLGGNAARVYGLDLS